ncbi:MAG: serine hydrolase [Anaerolineales bacterium]
MKSSLSRRDFLKLASLSLLGLAARPRVAHYAPGEPPYCSIPPTSQEVLSPAQRQRLLEASRRFLAPDEASANQVALDIDFIEGPNEHSSTMCGPLAITILQSARLLGLWARPADFWLINPRDNPRPIENTFPSKEYLIYRFDQPASEFDFNSFPLVSGDLVYLNAGPGDTFEHALVVNHVDDHGRAHSVTNFFNPEGITIEERILYELRNPGVGQFRDWADRSLRNKYGNVGRGGFIVWRIKDSRRLEFPMDPASRKLRTDLDPLLQRARGDWFAEIKEMGASTLYQYNPYEGFHPASTIKIPIALAFYKWLDGQEISDRETYLREHGTAGRSFAQLLEAMIVDSEELATEVLTKFLKVGTLDALWENWGLEKTGIEPRRSSASEIVYILERFHAGYWISKESRTALLNLMSAYTPNDESRIGELRGKLPRGSVIYNKRGSLVEWPGVVGDSAIIELPGNPKEPHTYIFSMHGVGHGGAGYEEMEKTLSAAVQIFGDFLVNLA